MAQILNRPSYSRGRAKTNADASFLQMQRVRDLKNTMAHMYRTQPACKERLHSPAVQAGGNSLRCIWIRSDSKCCGTAHSRRPRSGDSRVQHSPSTHYPSLCLCITTLRCNAHSSSAISSSVTIAHVPARRSCWPAQQRRACRPRLTAACVAQCHARTAARGPAQNTPLGAQPGSPRPPPPSWGHAS
jgi:hypothetical protein